MMRMYIAQIITTTYDKQKNLRDSLINNTKSNYGGGDLIMASHLKITVTNHN